MNKTMTTVCLSGLLLLSTSAVANVSSTVKVVSDYTFNGVSQTDSNPALQASLDYAADNGFYAGTWASSLDFGNADDTNIEWDAYVGKYFQINDQWSVDTGIAYYTYHGESFSDDYNYPEAYAKFGYNSSLGDTEFNFWYSWDYFGLDVNHYIAMVAHTFEVTEGHNIRVSFDRSTSEDEQKWAWDEGKSYNHIRVAYTTSYNGFDFDLSLEDTSMDTDNADTRIVLGIARTFSF